MNDELDFVLAQGLVSTVDTAAALRTGLNASFRTTDEGHSEVDLRPTDAGLWVGQIAVGQTVTVYVNAKHLVVAMDFL